MSEASHARLLAELSALRLLLKELQAQLSRTAALAIKPRPLRDADESTDGVP